MTTVLCPQCLRAVNVHRTPFGDLAYNRHMMAVLADDPSHKGGAWDEHGRGAANPDAAPINEIVCPMSGQVIE